MLHLLLPDCCTHSVIDEAALLMSDAAEKYALRQNADADKLRVYRAISKLLDAVLASLDGISIPADSESNLSTEQVASNNPPKPSETGLSDSLSCLNCGHTNVASSFYDGRTSIFESLRDDFYACPVCCSQAIECS